MAADNSGNDPYRITIRTWDGVTGRYQKKFMDLELYNDTYNTFCRLIPQPGARIFEIGCGPGNITRYLLARRPDFRIDATDAAPNMVQLAQANNPSAHCFVMDARDLDGVAERYDGIMCGFCMPYLSPEDCHRLVQHAAAVLSSGGIAYFSAIEGEEAQSGFEKGSAGQMYVYYHTESRMREWTADAGLQVADVQRINYNKGDSASSVHLVLIVCKP